MSNSLKGLFIFLMISSLTSCQIPSFLSLKIPDISAHYVVVAQPILPIILEENHHSAILLKEPGRQINQWMQGKDIIVTKNEEDPAYLRLDIRHERGIL